MQHRAVEPDLIQGIEPVNMTIRVEQTLSDCHLCSPDFNPRSLPRESNFSLSALPRCAADSNKDASDPSTLLTAKAQSDPEPGSLIRFILRGLLSTRNMG